MFKSLRENLIYILILRNLKEAREKYAQHLIQKRKEAEEAVS